MSEAIQFDLSGLEQGREPWPEEPPPTEWYQAWAPGKPVCRATLGGAEVDGRFYEDINCGLTSPDGRWMTYQTNMRDAEGVGRFYDQWVIDLASGMQRQLQAGQRQCQGDSFFGPLWSPNGSYLAFGDCADGGRIFLTNVVASVTRQISSGIPSFERMPDWSPQGDRLLYQGQGGTVVLEDVRSGRLDMLQGLRWQASFDSTGRYVYSPSVDSLPKDPDSTISTTIYDIQAGQVVATLQGIPMSTRLVPFVPVAGSGGTFVAALEGSAGCAGTAIFAGSRRVTCVSDAGWPTISPDGSRVALARKTGVTGHAEYPGGGSSSLTVFDILIVDVATGAERVVARNALGQDLALPSIWNANGTHILVRWPFFFGI